jgi:hypothetical protein
MWVSDRKLNRVVRKQVWFFRIIEGTIKFYENNLARFRNIRLLDE